MAAGARSSRERGGHAGVVFTPPELAARVLDRHRALAPRGAPILDPACGTGALLRASLEALPGQPPPEQVFGIEIDPDLAGGARERLRGAAVICGDALDPDRGWPTGTWIVANPPWLSFSGRHAGRPESGPGRRGRSGPGGWPALHSAFLDRIARHVAREGTGATLLLPGAVTELERYGPLRQTVTSLTRLDGAPEELGERAFPGVTEPAVLLSLLPRRPGGGSPAPWVRCSETAAALASELERFSRPPARTFADPGVHTGNCARELVLPATDHRDRAPGLRQGADLTPFGLGPPSAHLNTELEAAPGRRFRIAPLDRYRSFPILLRQTADRPMAALHAAPTYFRNSLLACRGVPGLDPAFLVAVLNGPVARAWHRLLFRDARQRAFPQVKVRHLQAQPLPIASREERPEWHDEVGGRVRALDPSRPEFKAECAAVEALVLEAFELSEHGRAIVLAASE